MHVLSPCQFRVTAAQFDDLCRQAFQLNFHIHPKVLRVHGLSNHGLMFFRLHRLCIVLACRPKFCVDAWDTSYLALLMEGACDTSLEGFVAQIRSIVYCCLSSLLVLIAYT